MHGTRPGHVDDAIATSSSTRPDGDLLRSGKGEAATWNNPFLLVSRTGARTRKKVTPLTHPQLRYDSFSPSFTAATRPWQVNEVGADEVGEEEGEGGVGGRGRRRWSRRPPATRSRSIEAIACLPTRGKSTSTTVRLLPPRRRRTSRRSPRRRWSTLLPVRAVLAPRPDGCGKGM